MTAQDYANDMTANGTYTFPQLPRGYNYAVEITGTFEAAAAVLGFVDVDNNFVAYKDSAGSDITATEPAGWQVRVPHSGIIAVTLSGVVAEEVAIRLTATLCQP
jgi:hypothetical protein